MLAPLTLAPVNPDEAIADARHIANTIAAANADDVDARARFPREAIDALKEARLLSAFVPEELGGRGFGMTELATISELLASRCASTGMVYAMHQTQLACLVRHAADDAYFRRYLRELCDKQLLIASATSEVGTNGDTRRSICALEREGDQFRIRKEATTLSYGADADDLLVTCRRNPDAAGSDQILVLLRKGHYSLTQTSKWDTLGMRGTCSPGYIVESAGPAEQVVPGSFSDSAAQTMVPFSHILWSAVWLGIASDAVARAGAFVRGEARKAPGVVPPTARRLAEVSVKLQLMRTNVAAVAAEADRLMASPEGNEALLEMGFALKMNNLKVASSEMASEIVHQALGICGVLGYRNDTKFSLGRHFRDSLSAALMIGNDRILSKSASLLLVYKEE